MPAARTAGMPATSNGAMSRSTSSFPSLAGAAGEDSLSVPPRRGEGTGSCVGSAPVAGGDGGDGASAGADVGDPAAGAGGASASAERGEWGAGAAVVASGTGASVGPGVASTGGSASADRESADRESAGGAGVASADGDSGAGSASASGTGSTDRGSGVGSVAWGASGAALASVDGCSGAGAAPAGGDSGASATGGAADSEVGASVAGGAGVVSASGGAADSEVGASVAGGAGVVSASGGVGSAVAGGAGAVSGAGGAGEAGGAGVAVALPLGRSRIQPGWIRLSVSQASPSGWILPRLASNSSRQRLPSPRWVSARLHGLSSGWTMIWPPPGDAAAATAPPPAGRVRCQPGMIVSGLSQDRPSGWGAPRLRSQISVHRAPSARCSWASAQGLSPGRTTTTVVSAAAAGTAGAATATGADRGRLGVAFGAGLGAGVLAAAGRAGSDGREGPASGPSQPTVIATVATRWRARRWIGPTAATRDASRPRTSAMISATRQATNTTHATHSATVNAPMIAESDATVPGRSRSWSREGRPVIGQWPQRHQRPGHRHHEPDQRGGRAGAPQPAAGGHGRSGRAHGARSWVTRLVAVASRVVPPGSIR